MGAIYEVNLTTRQQLLLEQMRDMLADKFGVTLQGNRVTLRYTDRVSGGSPGAHIEVHMIIEDLYDSATDPYEEDFEDK